MEPLGLNRSEYSDPTRRSNGSKPQHFVPI